MGLSGFLDSLHLTKRLGESLFDTKFKDLTSTAVGSTAIGNFGSLSPWMQTLEIVNQSQLRLQNLNLGAVVELRVASAIQGVSVAMPSSLSHAPAAWPRTARAS
jgi:hypothetical protein